MFFSFSMYMCVSVSMYVFVSIYVCIRVYVSVLNRMYVSIRNYNFTCELQLYGCRFLCPMVNDHNGKYVCNINLTYPSMKRKLNIII